MRYKDKVTIVTGGSQGIGEGCVRVFVKEGSKVVFCAPGENDGKELEADLNQEGPGEALYIQCDVTKEGEIKNMIEKTVEKYGRIDCLINNAGDHPPHKPIDDFSLQEFWDILDLNLIGYFLTAKYALPHLRKSKGNIINMSSLANQLGQVGAVTYATTKGGIAAMTRALAVDEAQYEVRVNVISPGSTWTPLWRKMANMTDDPEATRRDGENACLLGRLGTPEEMGKMALFLAAEGTFCTGLDVHNSGGMELSMGYKSRINSTGSWT